MNLLSLTLLIHQQHVVFLINNQLHIAAPSMSLSTSETTTDASSITDEMHKKQSKYSESLATSIIQLLDKKQIDEATTMLNVSEQRTSTILLKEKKESANLCTYLLIL
jgi:hypothetical protein